MEPIRVVGRKQKLMSFLRSEEGNAGRSKVLATKETRYAQKSGYVCMVDTT